MHNAAFVALVVATFAMTVALIAIPEASVKSPKVERVLKLRHLHTITIVIAIVSLAVEQYEMSIGASLSGVLVAAVMAFLLVRLSE